MAKNIARGLRFFFGKYKDEYIEKIMITNPGYIDWLLRNTDYNKYIDHIFECIQRFDNKPYTIQCFGINNETKERCSEPITKISLYPNVIEPYFWCKDCNPYQKGSLKELTIIKNYRDALDYVHNYCGNSNPDYRLLIEKIYKAKGLTGRKTNEKILSFFHD